MDSNLVSILMPAFNGEKFIKQAIESVLAQTYPNWELIIVDDGSTDSTAEIVASFKNSNIRYEYQMNRGQAAALNRGLGLARGEFIATLDVDDWYTPNSLYDRVVYLNENPEHDVVYGDGFYCDENGKPLMRFSENRIGDVVGDVYDVLITAPFFGTGGNVMVRKRVFDRYQLLYDESIFWCQDWDLYNRIAEHSTFGCVNTILLWYRIYEGNMTMAPGLTGRRLESQLQLKYKVLNSPKFSQIPTFRKVSFFRDFLLNYFYSRIDEQLAVTSMDQFLALPKRQQAILLRQVAVSYIFRKKQPEIAKELLSRAWSLNPLDWKTAFIYLLICLNTKFAEALIRSGRFSGYDYEKSKSPIQMVRESK